MQKQNFELIKDGLRYAKAPQKPTNRELLINPSYLIFIDNFKFEDEIVKNMKNRISRYNLYMGNSEFGANFKLLDIESFKLKNFESVNLDSFLEEDLVKNIEFKDDVFYKNTLVTTKLDKNRSPINSINLIYSNSKILAKNLEAYEIKIENRVYFCRFV